MSAQVSSVVANANLNGAQTKSANKSHDAASLLFDNTLAGHIQARQSTPTQDQGSGMGAEPTHAPEQAHPSQPQNSSSSQTNGNQQANAAQHDDGSKTEHTQDKPKHDDDGKDDQDPTTDAGNAAMAAALQAYVNKGLDAAQALAEAGGNKTVKAGGLAKALLDTSKDVTQSQTDAQGKLGGKDLLGELDAARQGLPQLAADTGKQADTQLNFQAELAKRIDTDAATRQPIALPTGQRVETSRSASVDTSKVASTLYQAVGADGWDTALGHKVVMMVSNQQQEVELQLNPPHLGPMDVKLSIDQDQAKLTFVVAHAPVREAVEASLPRLNQMLAESGIQLAQANVQARTQDGGNGQQSDGKQRGARGRAERVGAVDETSAAPTSWKARAISGLPGNVNLFV